MVQLQFDHSATLHFSRGRCGIQLCLNSSHSDGLPSLQVVVTSPSGVPRHFPQSEVENFPVAWNAALDKHHVAFVEIYIIIFLVFNYSCSTEILFIYSFIVTSLTSESCRRSGA